MNLIVIPFAQACRKAVIKEMTSSLISEYKKEINDYVIQPLKEIINIIAEIVLSIFSAIASIACGLKKICLVLLDVYVWVYLSARILDWTLSIANLIKKPQAA